MNHIIRIICLSILCSSVYSQQINKEKFDNKIINEDFKSNCKSFKIGISSDNYFILDKGELLLSRNNNKSSFTILSDNSLVSDFILKTSLKLEPSDNNDASIGVVLKAESDDKNVIIFEINSKGEYRTVHMFNGESLILNEKTKNSSWQRNKLINKVDKHNILEIRSEKNIFEIYVNSKFITSYFVSNKDPGLCGIIISPITKARVSYFDIYVKDDLNLTIEKTYKPENIFEEKKIGIDIISVDTKDLIDANEEIVSLNSSIKNLKQELNNILSKNQQLNIKISTLDKQLLSEKSQNKEKINNSKKPIKSDDISNNQEIKILQNEIISLKKINKLLGKELSKKNKELKSNTSDFTNEKGHKLSKKEDYILTDLNKKITFLSLEIESQKDLNIHLKNKNNELKSLFILKDFELNGVNPSLKRIEISNTKKVVEPLLKNEIYCVQIGVYMNQIPYNKIKNINTWMSKGENGTYTYYSGEFSEAEEATIHMKNLLVLGYKNSFVLTLKK